MRYSFVDIMLCPICESPQKKSLGKRGSRPITELPKKNSQEMISVSVYECLKCKHVYCNPCPDKETLNELYEFASDTYFSHLHESNLNSIEKLIRENTLHNGNLLDIGCGNGRLLELMKDWRCEGIEPIESFAVNAAKYGEIHRNFDSVRRQYDVIALLAVLEHVEDPIQLLKNAYAVANSKALLVIEVPNAHRPDAWLLDLALRLSGRSWTMRTSPLQHPFHLSEFSIKSMRASLESTGWEIEKIWTLPGNLNYPIPNILNRILYFAQKLLSPYGYGLNLTVIARRN